MSTNTLLKLLKKKSGFKSTSKHNDIKYLFFMKLSKFQTLFY